MTDPQIPQIPQISPQQAAVLAAHGEVLLLDVREPQEWQAGRAERAVHMPLGELDPAAVPDDRPVVAVCRSGNRSEKAAALLAGAGRKVSNMAGGMKAWDEAGLPMVTDDGTPGTV
jgi:rhodanese-related sulfurtransferase